MRLAIIGAGMAGLSAARALRELAPSLVVTLYEKGQDPGGRVVTLRRDGYLVDHGAQLFKAPDAATEQLVRHELPATGLVEIEPPVWIFDGEGRVAEGDPVLNSEPRLVYADGIAQLGSLLAAGLEVCTQTSIDRLTHDAVGYRLLDATGALLGTADLVLLTPPAPLSAEIVAKSELQADVRDTLLAELNQAAYRCCLSVALACAQPLTRPFYAAVNIDRRHPIAWLALEHLKSPTRCPAGQSLLVAQMGHTWSMEHWDEPVEALVAQAAFWAGQVLGEELGPTVWGDVQRWPYALPDRKADATVLNTTESGVFCAGDFCTDLGRVHLAIEQGRQVAAQIAAYAGGPVRS